jgi:hypothetical protein
MECTELVAFGLKYTVDMILTSVCLCSMLHSLNTHYLWHYSAVLVITKEKK